MQKRIANAKAAEIDSRRRVVDEKTLFLRLEDIWYRVENTVLALVPHSGARHSQSARNGDAPLQRFSNLYR